MSTIKSVLIIGGSGFLGTHIAQKLRSTYKVFTTYYQHPIAIPGVSCLPFNVENRDWVKRVVGITQPDVVIYLAGSNDMEWAEHNARMSERTHSAGTATLANTTAIMQPRFIFISNSYVFDGNKGNYHESDTVLPLTTLGRMKLSGENVVKNKCLNYIILRCSPLLGRSNGLTLSFFDQLRMTLSRNEKFMASHQELHSFTNIYSFCDMLPRLINSGVRNRVLHYGGLTKITAFELGKAFAKRFKLNADLVIPKSWVPRRGGMNEDTMLDFSLNSTQLAETLKVKPLLLEESFDLIEKHLISST